MEAMRFELILAKLEQFSRKYYTRMLLGGLLVFLAFGLLILFGLLSVEYFLWLPSWGRALLLGLCLVGETFLLYRFVLRPVLYLIRAREGLSRKEASRLIGLHFPEVGDKLYNLLDLSEDPNSSDLLLASIQQRSAQLSTVPFSKAIDYREVLSRSRYLLLPVLIFVLIWLSGSLSGFFNSYERVVNFNTAYTPPAPFVFETLIGDLDVLETESFTVQVRTRGSVKPEQVFIRIDGSDYLMAEEGGLNFYTFEPPLQTTSFSFHANGVHSRDFLLRANKVPAIKDFTMYLEYPAYLNRKADSIRSTGNASVPEGTRIQWKLQSSHTDRIRLVTLDTAYVLEKESDRFLFGKRVFSDFNYQLETSNEHVEGFETLSYSLDVIKDEGPAIRVREVRDSLDSGLAYYSGEVSDDHGLATLELVVYPVGQEEDSQRISLIKPQGVYQQFYYTFPSGLNLQEGSPYEYFFEVTDNDGIHGGKAAQSARFRTNVLDGEERRGEELRNQQKLIEGLDRTVKRFQKEEEAFESISETQKQKQNLNFNDQREIRDFLQRQQQQEEMMEKFSRELQENLGKRESDSPMDELMKERLERREQEARKNAALLEELEKVSDKLDKEELAKRLEELGKRRQSNERSLEQILELTKRYYVTEKVAQISRQLEKLAEEQEELGSDGKRDSLEVDKQRGVNTDFKDLIKELDSLREDNRALRKPLEIPATRKEEEGIQEDQRDALEELEDSGPEDAPGESGESDPANEKQRKAGEKMRRMGESLRQASMSGGGDSGVAEDAEMLRQILDNLITFSFEQEKLFEGIEADGNEMTNFAGQVKEQQELRELFTHVDDSLFALSLRRPEISELVNEQIADVYYNIDKALESIGENRIYQGVSHQQYVFTASNTLADFLAGVLDNMQQSLSMGSGQGSQGRGFQLPDIIQSQGELRDKMGSSGKEGKTGEGSEGSEGKKGSGEAGQGARGEGDGPNGEGGDGKESESGSEGKGGNEGRSSNPGMSESELEEVYEIYKEQQMIRQALEEQLKDRLRDAKEAGLMKRLAQQMEAFEKELLRSGITEQTRGMANRIAHELLKLDNAVLKQGVENRRESQANRKVYTNPIQARPEAFSPEGVETELLTREALPFHRAYQARVKRYFGNYD